MPRIPTAAAVVLALLAGLAFGLGPRADALLTPPPNALVAAGMVAAITLAIGVAMALASLVPWRLARRLTLVALMAGTLWATGQSARGAYAVWAFSGASTAEARTFLVVGANGAVVWVAHPTLPGRSFEVPGTPELVAAHPRGCVSVQVERSPSGAERFAPSAPLTLADVGACPR